MSKGVQVCMDRLEICQDLFIWAGKPIAASQWEWKIRKKTNCICGYTENMHVKGVWGGA